MKFTPFKLLTLSLALSQTITCSLLSAQTLLDDKDIVLASDIRATNFKSDSKLIQGISKLKNNIINSSELKLAAVDESEPDLEHASKHQVQINNLKAKMKATKDKIKDLEASTLAKTNKLKNSAIASTDALSNKVIKKAEIKTTKQEIELQGNSVSSDSKQNTSTKEITKVETTSNIETSASNQNSHQIAPSTKAHKNITTKMQTVTTESKSTLKANPTENVRNTVQAQEILSAPSTSAIAQPKPKFEEQENIVEKLTPAVPALHEKKVALEEELLEKGSTEFTKSKVKKRAKEEYINVLQKTLKSMSEDTLQEASINLQQVTTYFRREAQLKPELKPLLEDIMSLNNAFGNYLSAEFLLDKTNNNYFKAKEHLESALNQARNIQVKRADEPELNKLISNFNSHLESELEYVEQSI
jgi:hypothetical protein